MSKPLHTTKPKRRWLQFSMRSILVVVSLSCVALAVWVVPAERQRRAIEEFQAMGGRFNFVDNEAALYENSRTRGDPGKRAVR